MEQLAGFDFIALTFDGDGKPTTTAVDDLIKELGSSGTTDLMLMAHGFRNDEREARTLYRNFLENFGKHLTRAELAGALGRRKFAMAGIFWPSKKFDEGGGDDAGNTQGVSRGGDEWEPIRAQLESLKDPYMTAAQRTAIDSAIGMLDSLEEDPAAQDAFFAKLASLLQSNDGDPTEGQQLFASSRGSEVLEALGGPAIVAGGGEDDDGGVMGGVGRGLSDDDDGEAQGIGGFFRSMSGKVGAVLNGTTWYIMKNRAGTVGAKGVAPAVRAIKAAHPNLHIHLIGHSLGGRCMAATAKALSAPPMVQPDSVSLLEAAFSHYGFAADNGEGQAGFFRDVVTRQVVKGPLISTFSEQDTVVGYAYSIASRVSGDNTRAVGDKNSKYGGIGRNGTQNTDEKTDHKLREVGDQYSFAFDLVNNIDGSGGGITNHSDVTNPRVTYAVACAIAQT